MPASPATVYVLWHPAATGLGQSLATEIFNWFRLPDGDGIPVRYRSDPAPSRPGGAPLDLPGPDGGWQWVVVLAEDHMVADPVWRQWLTRLASESSHPLRRLFPVALSANAYNLPGEIRKRNFLRTPPLPATVTAAQAQSDAVAPRLLKDLTEAFCRVVAESSRAPSVPDTADATAADRPMAGAKVKVFLSHAKADSVEEARHLREYLYGETQLAAFFDENDIALGYDFGDVLERALSPDETAALIVLQSDAYATRPWCRREILAFRRPRPVVAGQGAGVWRMNPTLVVQTMRGPTLSRTIAELGTTPCIRWEAGREATIVTTLLREVLLAAFHHGLASHFTPAPGRVLINWRPDIPTIRLLQTQWPKGEPPLCEIAYPQHSVPRLELDALKAYFPELTFTAFSESGATTLLQQAHAVDPSLSRPAPDLPPFHRQVIGISISESDELPALGFAREHLREALLTLARPLLRLGADLAYGGHINDSVGSFTRDLIFLIAAEQRDAASPTANPADPAATRILGRLYNPQPWPHYDNLRIADEAQWIDVCTFVRVTQEMAGLGSDPATRDREILPSPADADSYVRLAFNRALVHSAMRRLMVEGIPVPGMPHQQLPRLAAAVLLGGKTRGFRGVLPGIFEEALCALRHRIPVFLLGGFGGAAARLTDYLQGRDSDAFSLEFLRQPEPPRPGRGAVPANLPLVEQGFIECGVPQKALSPAAALAELKSLLDQSRDDHGRSLHNGLTPEENRTLFATQDAMEASLLVQTGLKRVLTPASAPIPS